MTSGCCLHNENKFSSMHDSDKISLLESVGIWSDSKCNTKHVASHLPTEFAFASKKGDFNCHHVPYILIVLKAGQEHEHDPCTTWITKCFQFHCKGSLTLLGSPIYGMNVVVTLHQQFGQSSLPHIWRLHRLSLRFGTCDRAHLSAGEDHNPVQIHKIFCDPQGSSPTLVVPSTTSKAKGCQRYLPKVSLSLHFCRRTACDFTGQSHDALISRTDVDSSGGSTRRTSRRRTRGQLYH